MTVQAQISLTSLQFMKRSKSTVDLCIVCDNSNSLILIVNFLLASLEGLHLLHPLGEISGALAHANCQFIASFNGFRPHFLDELKCMCELASMNIIICLVHSASAGQIAIAQR